LANLDAEIEERSATVTSERLPTVRCAPTQITQVLQNLIYNAIRYCPDHPPRIHVRAEAVGNEWWFSVKDNGIGFDPRDRKRLFLPFERTADVQDVDGTGLGLAICKEIIESHGGRIWAESTPGTGSTFFFAMPRLSAVSSNAACR
jgi:chemotaxis family two-component system sensor kinase Cph1